MSESETQRRILLDIGSRPDTRLWRINVAQAWVGDDYHWIGRDLRITNARPLRAGTTGMSDILGLHRRVITTQDVGSNVGRFLALEVKSQRGGATPEQRKFLEAVSRFGGIAAVVRSTEDALAAIAGGLLGR